MEAEKGEKRKRNDKAVRMKRKFDQRAYTGDTPSAMIKKTVDDTNQLYAYNVTNFKVTELIAEATYSASQKAAVKASFKQLKTVLLESNHVSPTELSVGIPCPKRGNHMELISECTFIPPSSISLCGSFVTGLALCSSMTIDVRLIIPKKFYRQKDYLNQKWLVRKSYYAAVLAHHLRDGYTVKYACPHDSPLDVVLEATDKDSVIFRIFLHTEKGVFGKSRLLPQANNVRPEYLGLTKADDEASLTPTPLYNNALATNAVYGAGEQLTADWANESEVVRQCMLLAKIWMYQRMLDQGFQCMNAFAVRMFMIYLLKNRLLAYHTTGHQIFISFLQKLVGFNWSKPFSLSEDITPELLASHKQVSEIVFLDPTGSVNYCAAVSNQQLKQLKHHAKETVAHLLRDTDGSFSDTFIKKLSPSLYYDYSIRLNCVSKLVCTEESRLIDSCGDKPYSTLPKLLDVIRRALGPRVDAIAISPIVRDSVSVTQTEFSTQTLRDEITIGFHINLEHINRTLERGPPADDPSAEEFRQFWGEKSNLRRFMDGAICEAVLWAGDTVGAKRCTYGPIVAYALQRHCSVYPNAIDYGMNRLDHVLQFDNFGVRRIQGTGEEEASAFQSAFFRLNKQIRAITSLPLSVTDVLGLDPACRNTKLFPALGSVGSKSYDDFQPQRVICVVEGSKWPDKEDLEAIATLKMMMLLKMKESLTPLDGVTAFIREGGLTVFQDAYQYDISLMNIGELARLRHNHDSPTAKQEFLDYVVLPQITSTLSGLQSQHGTYAVTARLLKRWTGVHLLTSFLPEPVTDLIVASLFINSKPFQIPRCPMVAFHRALDLLVHHDWTNEPLILNFNEELNADALADLMEAFRSRRLQFPCATIITPADKESILSTKILPFMLKAVLVVAGRCLSSLNESVFTGAYWNRDFLKTALFDPDLCMMDVLIELRSERSRREPVELEQGHQKVDVFTDPAVNYVKHIEEAYGDKAVVMSDANNTKYIGLVWKPGAFNPVPVKIASAESLRGATALAEINNDLYVKFDIKAFLRDLNHVGQEMVANITVNSVPDEGNE